MPKLFPIGWMAILAFASFALGGFCCSSSGDINGDQDGHDGDTADGSDAGSDPGSDPGTDGGLDAGPDAGDTGIQGNNPPEPDVPEDDLAGGNPPSAGACPQQGLDEMCRRRDLAPVKPFEEVIDPDGWSQPETLIFHDTVTGAEIIRLTDDPAGSAHHCHINRSTFNADGSLVSFGSRRCWPGYYCPDNFRYVTRIHGKGPHIIEVPREHMLWVGSYEAWSPTDPDVFHFVNHADNNGLYRVNIAGGAFTTERLMELPNPDRRKHIFANVAPDGTLAIKDTNLENNPVHVYIWHPSDPGNLTTFDLDLEIDHPDHSISEEWHLHDFTLRRNPQDSLVFNYGPQGSSGEPLFFEMTSDGTRGYRVSYARNEDTHCPVPYYSHPAWNHDGTRVVFNGTAEKFADGTNPDGSPLYTWNDSEWGGYVHAVSPFDPDDEYATSTLETKVASLDQRIGHYAWDGFDDRWIHGAPSSSDIAMTPLYRLASDGSLAEVLVHTHARSRCTDDCDYCSLARPAQSPDATKVLYTSDMLQNESNHQDVYLAVHRYPYAPVWLGLASPNELRITWHFHQDLSRETCCVRLFRSADIAEPDFEPLTGVVAGDSYLDETANLADGESVLYAATGLEPSGLESRSLSRVIRVTRTGSTFRADQVTPYGTRDFDGNPPSAPSGLTAVIEDATRVRLTWTPPPGMDVRGYHVYAANGEDPQVTQAFLVASLPADHPGYLDWSPGTAAGTRYAVCAFDYQGNQSDPVRATATP
jgi:hypothetical protein